MGDIEHPMITEIEKYGHPLEYREQEVQLDYKEEVLLLEESESER